MFMSHYSLPVLIDLYGIKLWALWSCFVAEKTEASPGWSWDKKWKVVPPATPVRTTWESCLLVNRWFLDWCLVVEFLGRKLGREKMSRCSRVFRGWPWWIAPGIQSSIVSLETLCPLWGTVKEMTPCILDRDLLKAQWRIILFVPKQSKNYDGCIKIKDALRIEMDMIFTYQFSVRSYEQMGYDFLTCSQINLGTIRLTNLILASASLEFLDSLFWRLPHKKLTKKETSSSASCMIFRLGR